MDKEILGLLDRLERETRLSRKKIIEVISYALGAVAEDKFGHHKNISVKVDGNSGEISINVDKRKVPASQLGRVAALKVKQIIAQKIKEEEKSLLYEKFKEKKEGIVEGIVDRKEGRDFIINIDGVEVLLPFREILPQDNFYFGEKVKALVLDVNKESDYPVLLSRTHPSFLEKLLIREIPEIKDGIVEIKKIVRVPGYRAKVAVISKKKNIDSVGALVGIRGTRIKPIVQELRGEKIDIVVYSENPKEFISQSLSPAKVEEVELFPEDMRARVIVKDDQLSLAIGRKGQNVSLAVRLTGWSLDIRPLSYEIEGKKKSKKEVLKELSSVEGIDKEGAKKLMKVGFFGIRDISKTPREELSRLLGINERESESIINSAKEMLKKEGAKVE